MVERGYAQAPGHQVGAFPFSDPVGHDFPSTGSKTRPGLW